MMLTFQTSIRTRYAETDQMGYIYYGHYLTYFEVARTEAIKEIGLSYKDLEEKYGIMLPVLEANLKYKQPATYDELLILSTKIDDNPSVKIRFDTQIHNENGKLLVEGYVVLVFINKDSRQPCRPPQIFLSAFDRYKSKQ